ncbi:hypothetical protein GKZ68_08155 [Hymenobacter sp. BRD128]|uniref:hypothetical protein n=1 Tax=Hymenobacter sp. BRD128 TaxID=2675878 RepID=UPI0015636393|nr:hypothetical protein [Hymenobacter sp. BRD128]QKG56604.1 hypothetical protein GKZ68_08155 [Hymenobacter sp. BRD128]
MVALTIYWAVSYGAYTHVKGDESFVFMEMLAGLGYLGLGANALYVKSISWLVALVMPLVLSGLAVVLVFAALMLLSMSGYPAQLIISYGVSYSIVTLSTIVRGAYKRKFIAS